MRVTKKILAQKINKLLENSQLKDWCIKAEEIETYRGLPQDHIESGCSLMYLPLKRKDGTELFPIMLNAPYNLKGYSKELSKEGTELELWSSTFDNDLNLFVK